ncbi:MAG: glycosyltransferase family 2 protein [Acidimicrobiales bacterium]
MPAFKRFDLEGESDQPLVTDHEMRLRWASFHGDMRRMSGAWWQRVLGQLLGEDTRRYRVVRRLGRPLLQFARRLRTSRRDEPTKATAQFASAPAVESESIVFPINYSPKTAVRFINLAAYEVSTEDVTTVVVDETLPANVAVNAANAALETSTATWIFLCDVTSTEDQRSTTLRALFNYAAFDDDVVFADESGPNVFAPLFKFSSVPPHTLLSYNLVGRPALIRVRTLRNLGGFDVEAGWAFEHDAYLRLREADAVFHHVNLVLPAARPAVAFKRDHIDDDTCRVSERALARRGWAGVVTPGSVPGLANWRLNAPDPQPSIDVIIPTRDRIELVRNCIEALENRTTYENWNIILLDNDSIEPESLEYFAETKYQVVPCPGPFNYAKIVNRGVAHSRADYVVTLNNDTILLTPDWLERMVSFAALPDVAIVGACLLDQYGKREHESIVISPYPQHFRTDSNYPHFDQFSRSTRDVAAVTGAVQMVRREFWNSLGGMDERLAVTMNDVDLCLRAQSDTSYVLYTPDVQLIHHVSSSRGSLDPLEDRNRFIRRWDIFGTFKDPFFPEALLLLGETMFYLPR